MVESHPDWKHKVAQMRLKTGPVGLALLMIDHPRQVMRQKCDADIRFAGSAGKHLGI